MSELLEATGRPPGRAAGTLVEALRGVPVLAGLAEEDLVEFATGLELRELQAGEVLCRQSAEAAGLHILLSGEVRAYRRLPGEREIEVGRIEPGTVTGGILLLGGGPHIATARAVGPCSLAFLPARTFHARMQLEQPSAMVLKRRILEHTCARIRADHAWIASRIGGVTDDGGDSATPARRAACEQVAAAPAAAYALRLPFFAGMRSALAAGLLESGEALRFDPGCTVVEEGQEASRCLIVLNGAVEDVITRGQERIRVRFAGPGRAFGYLGLLDGRRASASSVARERTVLLAITADDFDARLRGSDELSRAFTTAIEADLMSTLHSTASPKAHLSQAGA